MIRGIIHFVGDRIVKSIAPTIAIESALLIYQYGLAMVFDNPI